MAINIVNDFNQAVTNDKYNQNFLSASAAKTQTEVVLQQIAAEKLEDTYDYINTTLEQLIVEAINKGTTKIQITFPDVLNKATIVEELNKAGYNVTNTQNGSVLIQWENQNLT